MPEAVSWDEIRGLCKEDIGFYNRTWFPKTFRKKSPPFHKDVYELLEKENARHTAIQIFRGGAKTTILRAFASKRIAYNTSRTILFVSNAEDQSVTSIKWIKRQVESNKAWASFYGLKRGKKWRDDYTEILHSDGSITTIIPKGITGQVRGINIDDYRPDLIIIDDMDDEETTATPTQREKQADLLFGALMKSLASSKDAEDPKLVLLQTPLDEEDQVSTCMKDRSFHTLSVSCFDDDGKSSWEDMFPSEDLVKDKQSHIDRGQISLWLREMECVLVSKENADFQSEWLKYYDDFELPEPHEMITFMGIDPVPPPSPTQLKEGLRNKDFEVLSVVGAAKGKFYLLELASNRGHNPDWTKAEFFRLVQKWNPLIVRVDGVAYQRTIKYILEEEMKKRHRYVQINVVSERRKKSHRIIQAFSGIASTGMFYISRQMRTFISQFIAYPKVKFDDELDATAMALDEAMTSAVDEILGSPVDEREYERALEGLRCSP